MAGAFGNPEIVEVETDILIVGGGMAGCGAALEAREAAGDDLKIVMVDKAALDRPTASAGVSALNTYLGDREPLDFARMVAHDFMGVARDDLAYDMARHVNQSVHMFEEWGLPVWKERGSEGVALADGGTPIRVGDWRVLINDEGYKSIVAETARRALGAENIFERVFITGYLLDAHEDNRIAGAVGFSLRDHKLYLFKANAILNAAGGCVTLFRSPAVTDAPGRARRPGRNAGSGFAMAAAAGAELTMMESRTVPTRFKDGHGVAGAWFQLFGGRLTNGYGDDVTGADDTSAALPACLRAHALNTELKQGRGPVFVDTSEVLAALSSALGGEDAQALRASASEDVMDMCLTQSGAWDAREAMLPDAPLEVTPGEPALTGGALGGGGVWVSGPEDKAPADWHWGYNRMSTVAGLFAAGDAAGASGHKFSTGAHAEGRIAGRELVRFCRDHVSFVPSFKGDLAKTVEALYRPVLNDQAHRKNPTADGADAWLVTPKTFQARLHKVMDEYGGGAGAHFQANRVMIDLGLRHIEAMKTDVENLRAKDLHELMRAWETIHLLWAAEAHLRHMAFREETRYPGFLYRTDFPDLDDENWKCFVNSRFDPDSAHWSLRKVPHLEALSEA